MLFVLGLWLIEDPPPSPVRAARSVGRGLPHHPYEISSRAWRPRAASIDGVQVAEDGGPRLKPRRRKLTRREARRVSLWVRMAWDALDRGEFDLAASQARKALALSPEHREAREALDRARNRRSRSMEEIDREWRTIRERLEYDITPMPEITSFPENWNEIAVP